MHVNGPDADAGVVFVVFTTPAAAAASLGAAVPAVSGLTVKPAGKVVGPAGERAVYAGSFTQMDALGVENVEGVTYAVVPRGQRPRGRLHLLADEDAQRVGRCRARAVRPCASPGRLGLIRALTPSKRMGGLHQGGQEAGPPIL